MKISKVYLLGIIFYSIGGNLILLYNSNSQFKNKRYVWIYNGEGDHTAKPVERSIIQKSLIPNVKEMSDMYLKDWLNDTYISCSGHFNGFSKKLLRLQNVIIDINNSSIKSKYRQGWQHILMQKGEEVYKTNLGFFKLLCSDGKPNFTFLDKSSPHLKERLRNILYLKSSSNFFYIF